MAQTLYTDLVTLIIAAWLNDVDANTYNALSAVAGTNTITATGPTTVTAYATNQRFYFIPAATNTGATTLNISNIGAKNIFNDGAACVGGELKVGVPVEVFYDGTQFQVMGRRIPTLGQVTNSLSGDVALSNTGTYFTGPTFAQGAVGTWFAAGTVTCYDTTGGAVFHVKLWDGTTVIASSRVSSTGANVPIMISLSGYLASPAGNLRISVKDVTSTSGAILFNNSGESKDSTLSAFRVA